MSNYLVWNNLDVTTLPNEALLKENVGDLIINLFPLDTPLHQVLGTVDLGGNVFYEQPVDTFSTALINRSSAVFGTTAAQIASDLSNAKPEGFTYVTGTPQYQVKMKACVAEIQGRQFGVSDTNRALQYYGMADRFAYEALKTTQAIVNQFELSMWWSPGTPPEGIDALTSTEDIVRQTQGLVFWIGKSGLQRSKHGLNASNIHRDGHGNDFGDGGGLVPSTLGQAASSWMFDAAGLPLDQGMFKDNLMAQWYSICGRQAGAVGFAGAKIKNLFSQFALTANGPINERTLEAAAKRVVDAVDYYETDFGVVSLNLCRYLNLPQTSTITTSNATEGDTSTTVPWDETMVFIQPRYFKRAVVRPVYMSPIGKTGDFEQGLVRGEQGLLCMNPQGGAGLTNCIP